MARDMAGKRTYGKLIVCGTLCHINWSSPLEVLRYLQKCSILLGSVS